ncbi:MULTISPECIES: hypothetical protein [Oceanobacillus]|uniref:Uncharacterized protein n=1 Tax=Oceanobacillus indicireducens TaxID=1004261 RepID=A0A917XU09_9BACI|nr:MULTISPECIES: hypothetical protein [Oceanobacillus]GGN51335.1 hypothetical protein GCM10007971_05710 [Oceanobacillus indicireducens]
MNVLASLLNLFVFVVPFIILYFVIAAGVKKGIEASTVGQAILEEHHERKAKRK